MDDQPATEGWAFPLRARTCHYFRKGKSLCGVWSNHTGPMTKNQSLEPSPDDCAHCRKSVNKMMRDSEGKKSNHAE
jgi:hypothetical protein